MARKKDRNIAFNLSFLDIMSCGFGAVILFFIIINHDTEQRKVEVTSDVTGEVDLLETELALEELNKVKLQNSLERVKQEIVTAEGSSERASEELEIREEELSQQEQETVARREHVNQLIAELQQLEDELEKIEAEEDEAGSDQRAFFGDGDRQYLTGLRVGGKRILILLDKSASMLDSTIVNIIRRRNLPDEVKQQSEKWKRALLTVEWITTQFGDDAQFQIAAFNVETSSVVKDKNAQWLPVERESLEEAIAAMYQLVPSGGTRLHSAMDYINALPTLPDNVFLIMDGLPTQGQRPATKLDAVSSRQRIRFFNEATRQLPIGLPVNVILFPMEGDPAAAGELWRLAIRTGGSFISPSEDWP